MYVRCTYYTCLVACIGDCCKKIKKLCRIRHYALLIFFFVKSTSRQNSWNWFHEKNLFFSSDIRDSLGTNCNTLSLHIKSIDVHASDLMGLLSLHTRHRALVHLSITTSKMLFTFIFSSSTILYSNQKWHVEFENVELNGWCGAGR